MKLEVSSPALDTAPSGTRSATVAGRAPGTARVFLALVLRDLAVLRKNFGQFLIRTVMQPLMLIFVFTYVLPQVGQARSPNGPQFANVLLPGMVVLAIVMQGFQSVAIPIMNELSVSREIEDRVLAPLPVRLLAVEKILMGAFNAMLAAAAVFPLALFLPATPVELDVSWPLLLTIGPLACVAAAAGGLTFATACELRRLPLAINAFLLPSTFLGAIFFRWERLSVIPWLQVVVLGNPIVYMSEGMRAALVGDLAPHMPLPAVYAALVGFVAVFLIMGIEGFSRRVQIGSDQGPSGIMAGLRRRQTPERRRWAPRAAVVAVAVAAAAAVAASLLLRPQGGVCPSDAVADRSFEVVVEGTPRVGQRSVELVVTRQGAPVEGALVCLSSVMVGMEDMGTSAEASPTGVPGRYAVTPYFAMGGWWKGDAVITEPGRPPVAVPLSLDVGEASMSSG